MAFCSNCGAEIPEGTKFCPNCGAAVKIQPVTGTQTGAQGASGNQAQNNYNQGNSYQPAAYKSSSSGEEGHGLAIGSLVCGIIGVVCWFFGAGSFLSIILGIVGLVLAGNSKKSGNSEGVRTAGFILSLIALIVGIIVFLYVVVVLSLFGATMHGLFDLLK